MTGGDTARPKKLEKWMVLGKDDGLRPLDKRVWLGVVLLGPERILRTGPYDQAERCHSNYVLILIYNEQKRRIMVFPEEPGK